MVAPEEHEDRCDETPAGFASPFSPRELEMATLEMRLQTSTPHASFLVFRSDMVANFGEGCFEKLSLRLIEALHGMWSAGLRVGAHERCEHCGESSGVEVQKAMTAYAWDGTGPDPNADLYLCRPCAQEYVDEWTERWDEYHAGLL